VGGLRRSLMVAISNSSIFNTKAFAFRGGLARKDKSNRTPYEICIDGGNLVLKDGDRVDRTP
jgi:hypothetical protein